MLRNETVAGRKVAFIFSHLLALLLSCNHTPKPACGQEAVVHCSTFHSLSSLGDSSAHSNLCCACTWQHTRLMLGPIGSTVEVNVRALSRCWCVVLSVEHISILLPT
jgi:hypothetical protein